MTKQFVISETGQFPAQYKVLRLDEDGIYKGQLVADDPSTPDVNEAYVGGKKPVKKKTTKKDTAKKKTVAKK